MSVSLGTFIRERRQDLGLSQEQLAERVGETVRQSEISRLEHDRVSLPRRERLEAIAVALDVSLGELLLRTGWVQDGDRLATGTSAATGSFRPPEDLDAAALQNMAAIIDSVAAVHDMVAEATLALEQAQDTMTSLMQSLNIGRNSRGVTHPPAGLMDRWETAAVFFDP